MNPLQGGSQPLVLVVGCDDRFAMPLAVTLYSALVHLPPDLPVQVHILDGGIAPRSRGRLERVVRGARSTTFLDWHRPDLGQLTGLRTTTWGSYANYLRLLIPDALGDRTDTAVYLDGDLLIRSDLSAMLSQIENGPTPVVLAVEDFWNADLGEVFGDQACLDLGLDCRAPYFNSGVLVINLQRWREEEVPARAFEFVRTNAHIMRYSDQDALNAVLAGRWERLDPRWNVMLPSLWRHVARIAGDERRQQQMFEDLLETGHVFHFVGPKKPWKPSYAGLPLGREYLDALFRSGWFDGAGERLYWMGPRMVLAGLWAAYRRLPNPIRSGIRAASARAKRVR